MLCFGSCGRCGWTLNWFGHGAVQRMPSGAGSKLVFPRKEWGEACRVQKQPQDNVYCVPSWKNPQMVLGHCCWSIFSLVTAFCRIQLWQEGIP